MFHVEQGAWHAIKFCAVGGFGFTIVSLRIVLILVHIEPGRTFKHIMVLRGGIVHGYVKKYGQCMKHLSLTTDFACELQLLL